MASSSSLDGTASASVSVFAPIAAPILRSVDPIKVAVFLKERERYEIEIESKKLQIPSLSALPYKASIDRTLLKNLLFMGKFDEIAKDATEASQLSDDEIKTYIESLVSGATSRDVHPSVIEKALQSWQMPTAIGNAEARITHFCADLFERLEAIGCGSFRETNPKKTVSLMINRIQPHKLKREMRKRISYDEGLERDVKKFITILIQEASNCQTYSGDGSDNDNDKSSNESGRKKKGKHKSQGDSNDNNSTAAANDDSKKSSKSKKINRKVLFPLSVCGRNITKKESVIF